MPTARIDLPEGSETIAEMADSLIHGYQLHKGPVLLLAYTDSEAAAREAIDTIRSRGTSVFQIVDSFHVHKDEWTHLDTGRHGTVPAETRTRVAAEFVARGHAQPVASRDQLANGLRGRDPGPVAERLPAATARVASLAADEASLMHEERWISNRISAFVGDQVPLSDDEAARMLADMQDTTLRDAAWTTMRQPDADMHVGLWTDLTRRAPTEVKTPAASLLAFASWLNGDGARAWVALDEIPEDQQNYSLARLVATSLMDAVPPDLWEETTAGVHVKPNDIPGNVTPRPGHRLDAADPPYPTDPGATPWHSR
jgi:hypothetical protein